MTTLRGYGEDDVNRPASMTGLRNLLDWMVGVELPSIPLVAAGALTAAVLSHRLSDQANLAGRAKGVCLTVAVTLTFVPLHIYDFVIAAILIILLRSNAAMLTVGCTLAMVALFRVNNMAKLLHIERPGETYFDGSLLASFAAVLLLICCVRASLNCERR
jgi:hypothetical protein